MNATASLPCLIVVGHPSDTEYADDESNLAARLLARTLPPQARRIDCAATTLFGLAAAASQTTLPDSATALLLAHKGVVPAPGTVARLMAMLDAGACAAAARSQLCPPAEMPPDYLTLRGMERYVLKATQLSTSAFQGDSEQPPALLATVGALRSGAWKSKAVWAPGAYCHDFSGYRGGKRSEIIPFVPPKARRILDVGGGEGGFLAALKATRPACETHLAESSPHACRIAADAVDMVWHGDFISLPISGRFDCITFLDVLEHTVNPGAWLERADELLAPEGVFILSIPNVGHWSVVADLIEGRWDYAPAGIHCITHLRFFTRYTIEQLVSDAGYAIVQTSSNVIPPPPWFDVSALGRALAIDPDSLATYSYFVVASKPR